MAKTFIGVREVDEETFRRFRARAVQERLKLGYALTLAMKYWMEKEKDKGSKKLKGPKVKPFSWGPGTKKLSIEHDKFYEVK